MIHNQTDPASECSGHLCFLLAEDDAFMERQEPLVDVKLRHRTVAVYECEACHLRLSVARREESWYDQTTRVPFTLLNSYRVPKLRHWESEIAQSFVLAAAGEPASSNYDRSSMLPGPGRE